MPNLTLWLIKNQVTIAEIAFRLGASETSVRNWQKGRTKPMAGFQRQLEVMYTAKKGGKK